MQLGLGRLRICWGLLILLALLAIHAGYADPAPGPRAGPKSHWAAALAP